MRQFFQITYRWARRCVIAALGVSVIIVGVLMIVLPGPAFIVIPAGVGILALEFECARHWLRQLRNGGSRIARCAASWTRRERTEQTPHERGLN